MKIHCTICGKKCNLLPARVQRGITKVDTFKCKDCWNKTKTGVPNPKLDMGPQRRIKMMARIRRENQYGDYQY